MRMSWRLAARQCRFEWSVMKVGTIFKAWRALTSYRDPEMIQEAIQRTENTGKTRQSMLKKQAIDAVKLVAEARSKSEGGADDTNNSLEGSVSSNDYDDEDIMVYKDENVLDGEADDAEVESDMTDDDEDDENIDAINESTAGFLKNIAMKNSVSSISLQGLGALGSGTTAGTTKGRRNDRKGVYHCTH